MRSRLFSAPSGAFTTNRREFLTFDFRADVKREGRQCLKRAPRIRRLLKHQIHPTAADSFRVTGQQRIVDTSKALDSAQSNHTALPSNGLRSMWKSLQRDACSIPSTASRSSSSSRCWTASCVFVSPSGAYSEAGPLCWSCPSCLRKVSTPQTDFLPTNSTRNSTFLSKAASVALAEPVQIRVPTVIGDV